MKKFLVSLSFIVLFSFSAMAQDYKTHKVKVGETIESIAKIYMVTPYDIYALNPDAKNSFQPNMVIIIPKSKVLDSPVETQVTKLVGYKTHKVKRRETLYSISKIYNISVDDIKKHNNRLYSENLRKGDKINIPKYDKVNTTTTLGNTIRSYKVLPKEGKWRIAYKFGITVDELEQLNPKMLDTLQVGQEINVPNIANNEEKEIDETYGYYTVVPREGFFALKRKLGLTQEEIESLNPELKEGGLKAGMIIKVPKDVNDNSSYKDVSRSVLIDKITNYNTKNLAVMLPFRLDRIDMDSIQEVKEMLGRGTGITNFSLDFHTGVLMALDSAKQLGISTKLDVYDTKARPSEVSNILSQNNFSQYDAVIGPIRPENFDRAAVAMRRDNVPMISPVSETDNIYNNVFQTIPSNELKRKRIVEYVKQLDSIPSRILIISDQAHRSENNTFKQEFPSAKQIFSRTDEDTGKDMFYILMEDIEEEFREGLNLVFLESNNEGFVSNVTSMLTGFIGFDEELEIERKVVLVTSDKNRAFDGENVSNVTLSKLKFMYPSPNKPFNNEQSNSFVRAYKERFYTTPNRFAIRGFDLTMDVLLRLASAENLYEASSNDIETEYVENKFRYGKKMFGGYYNEAMYIVKFDNLKIVEVKK
ncbi:amino acid ABC transporter substrate-binding protein [Pontimicrobium aquaticum]|uniref:LysM peptidoglycan-binding domain-containing protein n=1 Tax=Pontimicrobium aquaticum TaxID=2565367 RepID=A0A4U0EWJ8_9FLAO|nr:LysM peptidoglycan-binding domain-containing protein [Pontimicrobium aquaticum]TJY36316.1 LysM peptidoglycan-binding domain-containing protein [Pontimicrobium aquaticum]